MTVCRCCGRREELPPARVLCDECIALGFDVNADGQVVCPTCGNNFKECACSAPDSACM